MVNDTCFIMKETGIGETHRYNNEHIHRTLGYTITAHTKQPILNALNGERKRLAIFCAQYQQQQ